jgi:hypothetical protein
MTIEPQPAQGPKQGEITRLLQEMREGAASQKERSEIQQERIDLAARELAEVSDRLQAAANALRESI